MSISLLYCAPRIENLNNIRFAIARLYVVVNYRESSECFTSEFATLVTEIMLVTFACPLSVSGDSDIAVV